MKRETTGKGQSILLLQLLKGGVAAVLVAVAILVGVALLVSGGVLNRTLAESSVIWSCVFGALVGGCYALKQCERGILLVGIGAGVVEWLILVLGAICIGGFARVGEMGGTAAACLGGSLLAGVLCALRGSRRKHKGDYRM